MNTQIKNFLRVLKTVFDDKAALSLEEPVEWNCLSQIARKQNLLPLFFEAASRVREYTESDGYMKDQLDTFSMVAVQVQNTIAFVDIYEKITAQGIYPIVMKGIVCRQLYGELGEHRPSGDEDVLIEVKDFWKVKSILEQENYTCSFPDITERELTEIQEVSFYHMEHQLTLEVHTNIIGKENDERAQMNRFFEKAHEHGQIMQIEGIDVKVMELTESLLFLILHAYKHFTNRGVGIRQVMDILLYYREFRQEISMEYLQKALETCKVTLFWNDLLYIGNQYLGLCEERPEKTNCPEELLQDMLQEGVFGGQDKTDHIAAAVNLNLESSTGRQGKFYTLLRAAFPTKRAILAGYPFLEEKPWLLPGVWVKRWMKFARYSGKDVWKISSEILQKSSARREIINKYKK